MYADECISKNVTIINEQGTVYRSIIQFWAIAQCNICNENKAGVSITNDAETVAGCDDPKDWTGSERWTHVCIDCMTRYTQETMQFLIKD